MQAQSAAQARLNVPLETVLKTLPISLEGLQVFKSNTLVTAQCIVAEAVDQNFSNFYAALWRLFLDHILETIRHCKTQLEK